MNALLFYLLQVIVVSGILYGYYHFALRNNRFHRYNRFYLLASTIVSVAIPFLNIPVYFTQSAMDSSFVLQTLTGISSAAGGDPVTIITSPKSPTNWFTWETLSSSFYILIALLLLLRIAFSLLTIRRIVKNNPVEHLDKIHFINTSEPGTPFSFFRWLFWNKKIELHSEKGEQIFRHELFHIEQKHSRDIIYTELLTVVFWINPFFHLMKKEVKAIHEFLADQFAVTENKKWEYAELLLMQAFNTNQRLVNPFFHNQIKRRIAMITTSKKPSYQYFRKLMVLPVAVLVIGLFAFSYKNKKQSDNRRADQESLNAVMLDVNGDRGQMSLDHERSKIAPGDTLIPLSKNTTDPSNDFNHITFMEFWDAKKRIVAFKADSFVFKSQAENNMNADLKLALLIFNGERKDNRLFSDQLIVAKTITIYPANDLAAIKKYGEDARKGVIVIEDGSIEPMPANGKYIKGQNEFSNRADTTKPVEKNLTLKEIVLLPLDTTSYVKFMASDPLIVIDGVIQPGLRYTNLDAKISVNDIQSINVFKDQQALLKYGEKGRNGVIEINSKKRNEDSRIQEITLSDTIKPQVGDNKIFTRVEIEPSFPGGEGKWKQYLAYNAKNFNLASEGVPAGNYTVIVQFIVDKAGFIHDIKASTKLGFGMEEEAIRLIAKGPKWVPAIQNGFQVTAYKKQPITFIVGGNYKAFLNEVVVIGYREDKGRYTNLPKNAIAPSFVGDETEWRKHLERNVNSTIPVDNGAPAGTYTTVTQFLVKADGTTSEFKSITNHGYGMEEEALRVIQSAKKWDPAIVNGEKANVYKIQPVTFVITKAKGNSITLTNIVLPVENAIVRNPYGRYIDESGQSVENPGITFSATKGSRVRSMQNGIIAAVFTLRGFKAIAVRENNYFTTYSGLENLRFTKGQKVNKYDILGEVTASRNYELDFSVMEKAKSIDPIPWLKNQ